MNLYFDTEFTGLFKNTELISIGIIDDVGREFYAEINNIDVNNIDDWIKVNVLGNTACYGRKSVTNITRTGDYVCGTLDEVRDALLDWLSVYDSVQFVSDVCHYDFVLLIDIFGTAFDLPINVNPSCHDINQDIAKYKGITESEAFDYSRELLVSEMGAVIVGDKHNAMYDAIVIKALYLEMSEMV